MLQNISITERRVFLNIDGKLYPVTFKKYLDLLDDCYSNYQLNRNFLKKYKVNFKPKKDLSQHIYNLVDKFRFVTFDKGDITVELHKFDADYDFKYFVKRKTKQTHKIKEDFETLWANDDLAVLLF